MPYSSFQLWSDFPWGGRAWHLPLLLCFGFWGFAFPGLGVRDFGLSRLGNAGEADSGVSLRPPFCSPLLAGF